MIGCLLLGAGLVMMARAFHRHRAWHYGYGRWAHCGGGWRGGHGWHAQSCGPANDDGFYGGDYGRGDDYGPSFGHGPRWFGGGRFRNGFVAGVIAERLEATPAQERVIRDAVDEFREAATKLKGEGRRTRDDVAAAFRKGHFDEVLFGELFARHDGALTDLRKAFVGMGARIHDALDDKQRARLAELIEAGPGAFRPRFRGGRGGWS
jgi:hypothetical protein